MMDDRDTFLGRATIVWWPVKYILWSGRPTAGVGSDSYDEEEDDTKQNRHTSAYAIFYSFAKSPLCPSPRLALHPPTTMTTKTTTLHTKLTETTIRGARQTSSDDSAELNSVRSLSHTSSSSVPDRIRTCWLSTHQGIFSGGLSLAGPQRLRISYNSTTFRSVILFRIREMIFI